MKAGEVSLTRFLSQTDTQFVIPVYQRNYDWAIAQCKVLLNDILEAGKDEDITAHFIGSVVFVHDELYSSSDMCELSIIDGQQRLTTVTILYIALYDYAKNHEYHEMAERIFETYLINKFSKNEEKLKLRPTENNDKAIKYLIDGDFYNFDADLSRIYENFQFFRNSISSDNFDIILCGLDKLMFVEVSLDRHKDNPQRIFESLNSTGLDLSQADLIRNYILMSLNREEQTRIYERYWAVIEKLAKDETTNTSLVSAFVRDYLTLVTKKIPNKGAVYEGFKSKFPTTNTVKLESALANLKGYAHHYNKLINPANEKDLLIRLNLNYIKRLEINVCYPFLVQVYEDYERGVIDVGEFVSVLDLVQSFSWRRFLVGLGTNALNRIFMTLYADVDLEYYVSSLEIALLKKSGNQKFPRDSEIKAVLREKDIYNIKSKNRVYLLERLENHNNKEYVKVDGNTDITIEHIFPKNPSEKWFDDLALSEFEEIKEKYLNSLANLTLSGNNGALGNKSFLEKKNMNVDGKEQGYIYSRIWLNRYLADIEEWNIKSLESRFDVLWERFLEIWKLPKPVNYNDDSDEINIFDITETQGEKIDYASFLGDRLVVSSIGELYQKIISGLYTRYPDKFKLNGVIDRIQITKSKVVSRRAIRLSDKHYYEANISNNQIVSRVKYLLELCEHEEDLYIKWKNTSIESTIENYSLLD